MSYETNRQLIESDGYDEFDMAVWRLAKLYGLELGSCSSASEAKYYTLGGEESIRVAAHESRRGGHMADIRFDLKSFGECLRDFEAAIPALVNLELKNHLEGLAEDEMVDEREWFIDSLNPNAREFIEEI